MDLTKNCYSLPEPSTSSYSGVRLCFPGGVLKILFDYDKDGCLYNSGLVFNKVRAHRHTAESHCPAWKIEAAYDTLVEINNSEWTKEILASTVKDEKLTWQLNHYLIYFDGDGCYEIVSESWEALPEKEGSLSC